MKKLRWTRARIIVNKIPEALVREMGRREYEVGEGGNKYGA